MKKIRGAVSSILHKGCHEWTFDTRTLYLRERLGTALVAAPLKRAKWRGLQKMIPLKLYVLAGFEYFHVSTHTVFCCNPTCQSHSPQSVGGAQSSVRICLTRPLKLLKRVVSVIMRTIITSQLQVGKRAKKRQKVNDLCSGFYSLLKSYHEYLAQILKLGCWCTKISLKHSLTIF